MEERNEITEMNNGTTEVTEYDEGKSSGGGLGKFLFGLGAATVAGVAVAVVATKDKRKAKQIEKLKKEGYIIYHEDDVEEIVEVDEDEDKEELIDEKVTEIKKRKDN